MKNPNRASGIDFRWLKAFCWDEAVGPAVDMDGAS
jgi:hypothetical protein